MIDRPEYLNQLIRLKDKNLIKVITGIRRCGKSTLFELYQGWLLENGVKENRIIKVALDDDKYKELRNPEKLSEYVHSRIKEKIYQTINNTNIQ